MTRRRCDLGRNWLSYLSYLNCLNCPNCLIRLIRLIHLIRPSWSRLIRCRWSHRLRRCLRNHHYYHRCRRFRCRFWHTPARPPIPVRRQK